MERAVIGALELVVTLLYVRDSRRQVQEEFCAEQLGILATCSCRDVALRGSNQAVTSMVYLIGGGTQPQPSLLHTDPWVQVSVPADLHGNSSSGSDGKSIIETFDLTKQPYLGNLGC